MNGQAAMESDVVLSSGHKGMHANDTSLRSRVLAAACVIAMLAVGILWHRQANTASELAAATAAAAQFSQDIAEITKLRRQPQRAAKTSLPLSDLLERVHEAMRSAGVSVEHLVSTIPEPHRATQGTDLIEVTHRLVLEDVDMRSLVKFCHAMIENNIQLRVSALQLRAASKPDKWNTDVSLTYWIADAPEGS